MHEPIAVEDQREAPERDPAPDGVLVLNALAEPAARDALAGVCSSRRWVDEVLAERPYASTRHLLDHAERVLLSLSEEDLDEALAGHPRIGERGGAHPDASGREQAGVQEADEQVRREIAEGNRAYEERFGHVYLVRARGRSAGELLALLRERLGNDPRTERDVVRRELAEINALRLEELLQP